MRTEEITSLLPYMTADERAELQKIVWQDKAVWRASARARAGDGLLYHGRCRGIWRCGRWW